MVTRIGDTWPRARIAVTGDVLSCTAARHSGSVAYRVEIGDGTGRIALLFFGRSSISGLVVGARVRVWGRAIPDESCFVVWNPRYELTIVAPDT